MNRICKRGHQVPGRSCKECKRITDAKLYADNTEQTKTRVEKYRRENLESVKARDAARYASSSNGKACRAQWKRDNPEKVNAYNAARRATKRSQLCNCCASKDIRALYSWARQLGCEVDHRRALRLGGSHCLKNLDVLAPAEHKEKTKQDAALIANALRRNK